jgi:ubiquinol-cytochrome c reductase iron-sulfur subunit
VKRAELTVVVLFVLSALGAIGFVVVYAIDGIPHQTQFLGLALGLSFLALAAAFAVLGFRLVDDTESSEEYPPEEHTIDVLHVEQLIDESSHRLTRKRLVLGAGAGAVGVLGAALAVPALSLGPALDLEGLADTPWRRGRLLVGDDGVPLRADEIEEETFYTAYPAHADREHLGAPLVVVRLAVSQLALPDGRGGWAPRGIVAYSKICTHAGCAISLYRKPTFPEVQPKPALVCPCHYSTFDPARGGKVLFGPAGRPLPQLPLEIDERGELRAGGTLSAPVGPSWWGVRSRRARS